MIHHSLVSGFAGDLSKFDMSGKVLGVLAKHVREKGVLIFPMRDLLAGGEEKAAGKGEKEEQGRPRSELEKKGARASEGDNEADEREIAVSIGGEMVACPEEPKSGADRAEKPERSCSY